MRFTFAQDSVFGESALVTIPKRMPTSEMSESEAIEDAKQGDGPQKRNS
jgi:hypothetical protein